MAILSRLSGVAPRIERPIMVACEGGITGSGEGMETGLDKTQQSQNIPTRIRVYLRVFAELPADALRLLFGTACIWIGIGVFGVLFNLYLIAIGQSLAFLGL